MPRKDVPPKEAQKEPTVDSYSGIGTLQRRMNGSLRLRVKVSGVCRSRSFKKNTKFAKIKQVAKDLEDQLSAELEPGRRKPLRMSELLLKFEKLGKAGVSERTAAAYDDSLKTIKLFFVDGFRDGPRLGYKFRDPWVHEVEEGEIIEFMAWRSGHTPAGEGKPRRTKIASRTVNKDRAVLHKIFNLGKKLKARSGENPVREVPPFNEPDFLPTILSPTQVERFLKECRRSRQRMLFPFSVLLADAAVRSEKEALHLTWRCVDLENRVLVIKGKGGKIRLVPMSKRLHLVLAEHADRFRNAIYHGKKTEWVFHHTEDRRHHRAGTRIKSMRVSFQNAAARAEIEEEFRQHDMRHSTATNWLAAGASQKKVQTLLGHSDPRMTDRYTHLIAEHLRDVVDLLEPEEVEEVDAENAGDA